MAKLDSLIRVRKHAVEQKQKLLSELYRQAEELEGQKGRLLEQMEEERQKLQELGIEMLSYFGPYSDAVKERVADIDEAMKLLETRIQIAREDIRSAFAELKKIEITKDRREDEEVADQKRKESQELDEIALEGFRRNQEES